MRIQRLNRNSRLVLTFAFGALLALPGCNVNVKKDSQGKDNNVDIETPVGGLHVTKGADIRDIGLPVYPGARRKELSDNGDENSAHVNLSTSLFGLKVVAIEYLSDDPSAKLIAYYKDQLKKFGNVLECHTDKVQAGTTMDFDENSSDSKLTCDKKDGSMIELKAGTRQNQHIVSIKTADDGKGSDFGLVYVQIRGGKDTI